MNNYWHLLALLGVAVLQSLVASSVCANEGVDNSMEKVLDFGESMKAKNW